MARYLADLDANATLDNTDIALIEQSGIDKKVTLVEIKNFVLESVFPIGSTYLQLPSMGDPSTLNYPGTWTNVSSSYAGDFFRVEGGDAVAYDAGQQLDQFQGHNVTTSIPRNYDDNYHGTAGFRTSDDIPSYMSITGTIISDGAHGTPRVGSETRPVNQTIRVWERTA